MIKLWWKQKIDLIAMKWKMWLDENKILEN